MCSLPVFFYVFCQFFHASEVQTILCLLIITYFIYSMFIYLYMLTCHSIILYLFNMSCFSQCNNFIILSHYRLCPFLLKFFLLHVKQSILFFANAVVLGSWSENILQYFLRNNQITTGDGAQITWYHAANHKAQLKEALKSKSV